MLELLREGALGILGAQSREAFLLRQGTAKASTCSNSISSRAGVQRLSRVGLWAGGR